MFDALLFIAQHEGMSLVEALETAYEQGANEEDVWIPVDRKTPCMHQAVYVTCEAAGRKNWVCQTTYRGQWDIPIVNTGEGKVIAWTPFTVPAPYKGGRI